MTVNFIKLQERFWLVLSSTILFAILVAAVRWALGHPYAIHWDEAAYFDTVQLDLRRLTQGNLLRLAGRILLKDWGRPPAYRILSLPVFAVAGFHPFVARLVSLACFSVASWFVYKAAGRIASPVAGAISVLVFALSPEVLAASMFFGTDTSIYLATAATLYYVFACWTGDSELRSNWIGLGLALGLGFLSKPSFAVIALPIFAYWWALDRWGHLELPKLNSRRKAAALALVIAAPWWLLRIKSVFTYVQFARGDVRNSLGPPGFATWLRWLNTVVQCLLGHGVSILIALVVISCLVKVLVSKEAIASSLQKAALGACVCAGAPLVLAQLSGTNHLLRHISPAIIPLAIIVGVLVDSNGWAYSWKWSGVFSTLFCAQLLMILYPVVFPNKTTVGLGYANGFLPWRVFVQFDQWDWRPVRDLGNACDLASPNISYLGNGREFDEPQIEYPWYTQKAEIPDVKWLWRFEDGPLDWQKVMDAAGKSDFVLTAPQFAGEATYMENLDNQHNAEFAARLSQDPRFRLPIRLEMGRFEPIEVNVFLQRSLVCRLAQPN